MREYDERVRHPRERGEPLPGAMDARLREHDETIRI